MSTAITTAQKELKQLASKAEIQEAFQKVLGENANAFIASMLTAVNTNDRLKFCDPISVINCAMLAASLDLPIEQNLGQAWMIPFKDKGVDKAQFQIGYKGLIQLALRSGEYKTINASVIYNGMSVKTNVKTGEVDVTGEQINDEAIGFIAYIETLNGYNHTVYMTSKEMTEHAKKYSKSFGYDSSPWTTNYNQMGLKTVIRRILTKYGILSVKMTRALQADVTPIEQVDMSDTPQILEGKTTEPRKSQSKEANLEQLTGQKQPRPWSTDHVRERINGWMMDLDGQTASDNQRKVLAAVLDKVLGDKTKRYEVCQYLTGTASTQHMDTQAIALLNWLGVARFEDIPNAEIVKEIHACHTAALKEAGQMEMMA